MIFTRNDSQDTNGGPVVSYLLADCPGYNFSVSSSRAGLVISGTTPPYTDWRPMQQVLTWAQYQCQAIKKRGHPIRQDEIDRGGIWL